MWYHLQNTLAQYDDSMYIEKKLEPLIVFSYNLQLWHVTNYTYTILVINIGNWSMSEMQQSIGHDSMIMIIISNKCKSFIPS